MPQNHPPDRLPTLQGGGRVQPTFRPSAFGLPPTVPSGPLRPSNNLGQYYYNPSFNPAPTYSCMKCACNDVAYGDLCSERGFEGGLETLCLPNHPDVNEWHLPEACEKHSAPSVAPSPVGGYTEAPTVFTSYSPTAPPPSFFVSLYSDWCEYPFWGKTLFAVCTLGPLAFIITKIVSLITKEIKKNEDKEMRYTRLN